MTSCLKGSSGNYPTKQKNDGKHRNNVLGVTNWEFREKTLSCSIPTYNDKLSCEKNKGTWTQNPKQQTAFKKWDKLSVYSGKDILWGQSGDKGNQVWPYDMKDGEKDRIYPCSKFNQGYTGNIFTTCSGGTLQLDLSRCLPFHGCLYGKKNVKGDKRVSCYSAMKGKDALCHHRKPGQYRCFCPPNYYGDGIETGTQCKKCPANSSNKGIDETIWKSYTTDDHWFGMGASKGDFPNSTSYSCMCDKGYESNPKDDPPICRKIKCPLNSVSSSRKPPFHCNCKHNYTNQPHTFDKAGWKINLSGIYKQGKDELRIHQIDDKISIYDKNDLQMTTKNSIWDTRKGVAHIEWTQGTYKGQKTEYRVIIEGKNQTLTGEIKQLTDTSNKSVPLIAEKISLKAHNLHLTKSNPSQPWIGKCARTQCLINADVLKKRKIDILSCSNVIKNTVDPNQSWGVFNSGETCKIACETGYHPKKSGGGNINCNAGKLIQPLPECILNQCVCSNGQKVNDSDCISSGDHLCKMGKCNTGYEMFNANKNGHGQCEKPTICQKGLKIKTAMKVAKPHPSGDRDCEPCKSGEYTDKINRGTCSSYKKCPKGKEPVKPFTLTSDITCRDCSSDEYKSSVGNTDCVPKNKCDKKDVFEDPTTKKDLTQDTKCNPVAGKPPVKLVLKLPIASAATKQLLLPKNAAKLKLFKKGLRDALRKKMGLHKSTKISIIGIKPGSLMVIFNIVNNSPNYTMPTIAAMDYSMKGAFDMSSMAKLFTSVHSSFSYMMKPMSTASTTSMSTETPQSQCMVVDPDDYGNYKMDHELSTIHSKGDFKVQTKNITKTPFPNHCIQCGSGYRLIYNSDHDPYGMSDESKVKSVKEIEKTKSPASACSGSKQCICAKNVCKAPKSGCPMSQSVKKYNSSDINQRCINHNQEVCTNCKVHEYWNGKKCATNHCSCKFGQVAKGTQCTINGGDICTKCNTGYHIQGKSPGPCIAYAGTCNNGQILPISKRTKDNECYKCNSNYKLDKTTNPPVCKTSVVCDASQPPKNGGLGRGRTRCSATLALGATCEPTCNMGYVAKGGSRVGTTHCDKGTLIPATCSEESCPIGSIGPKPKTIGKQPLKLHTKLISQQTISYDCKNWDPKYVGQISGVTCDKGNVSITKGGYHECSMKDPCSVGGDTECQSWGSKCDSSNASGTTYNRGGRSVQGTNYVCKCPENQYLDVMAGGRGVGSGRGRGRGMRSSCRRCPGDTRSVVGSVSISGCSQCGKGKNYIPPSGNVGPLCMSNVCTCSNGVAASGDKCDKNNKEVCVKCDKTHELNRISNTCIEKDCIVPVTKPQDPWYGRWSSLNNSHSRCEITGKLMKATSRAAKPRKCKPTCVSGYSNKTTETVCRNGAITPIQCDANICDTVSTNCKKPAAPGHPGCTRPDTTDKKNNISLCSECNSGYRLVKTKDIRATGLVTPYDYNNDSTIQIISNLITATPDEIKRNVCECVPIICQCKDGGRVVGPATGPCNTDPKKNTCKSCYKCNSKSINATETGKATCRAIKILSQCSQNKACQWTNRSLTNTGECISELRCSAGKKYVSGTGRGTCKPCDTGKYRPVSTKSPNHRETTCLPQETCLSKSAACMTAWSKEQREMDILKTGQSPKYKTPFTCYVSNTNNKNKEQINKCMKNDPQKPTDETALVSNYIYKDGSLFKNQVEGCENGFHLIKTAGGKASSAYCQNNPCICKKNQCICPDRNNPKASQTANATSGSKCSRDGNIECAGCPTGFYSMCPRGQKASADHKTCVPTKNKNRITDCTRKICNCFAVIKPSDMEIGASLPSSNEGGWESKESWSSVTGVANKKFTKGSATSTSGCATDGTTICLSCPIGFKISGKKCVPMNTSCPNGSVAPIFDSTGAIQRTKDNQCYTCNANYRLVYTDEVGKKSRPPSRSQAQCLQKPCSCVSTDCDTKSLNNSLTKGTIKIGTMGDCSAKLLDGKTCTPTCDDKKGFYKIEDPSCSLGQLSQKSPCKTKICKCDKGSAARGVNCKAHGNPGCSACRVGFYLNNGLCHKVSSCVKSQYERSPASPTTNTVCADIKVCNTATEYESKSPSSDGKGDRICSLYPRCPTGRYLENHSSTKKGQCVNCPTNTYRTSVGGIKKSDCVVQPTCLGGHYISNPGVHSLKVKKECKACPSGEWQPTVDQNSCSPLKICSAAGTEMKTPGTSTANTGCLSCDDGKWRRQDITGKTSCAAKHSCTVNEFIDPSTSLSDKTKDSNCITVGTCQRFNPDSTNGKNLTLDTITGSSYNLISKNIQKFTNQCISCGPGYHLVSKNKYDNINKADKTKFLSNVYSLTKKTATQCETEQCICVPNKCQNPIGCKSPKTYNGITLPRTTPDPKRVCMEHESKDECGACISTKHWDPTKKPNCQKNICNCRNGTSSNTSCNSHNADICSSCNKGYHLVNNSVHGQCVPYTGNCQDGCPSHKKKDTKCSSPIIQANRLRENQCNTCHTGFKLILKSENDRIQGLAASKRVPEYIKAFQSLQTAKSSDPHYCSKNNCLCVHDICDIQSFLTSPPDTNYDISKVTGTSKLKMKTCQGNLLESETCKMKCKNGFSSLDDNIICSGGRLTAKKPCLQNKCNCNNGTSVSAGDPLCNVRNDGTRPELCKSCNSGFFLNSSHVCIRNPKCNKGEWMDPGTASEISKGNTPICRPLISCQKNATTGTSYYEAPPYVNHDGTSTKDRKCIENSKCKIGQETIDIKISSGGRGYTRTCTDCQSDEYGSGHGCSKQVLCAAGQETMPATLKGGKVDKEIIKSCKSCKLKGNTYSPNAEPDHQNLNTCITQTTCQPGKIAYYMNNGSRKQWDKSLDLTRFKKECESCPVGTFTATIDSQTCTPWNACSEGQYESSSPSSNKDRSCSTTKTCMGGSLVSLPSKVSETYRRIMDKQCGSCNEGYHLRKDVDKKNDDKPPATTTDCENNRCHCAPNKCFCGRSGAKPKQGGLSSGKGWGRIPGGDRCYVHKPVMDKTDKSDSNCIGCPPGFWLDTSKNKRGICEPNTCICQHNNKPVANSKPASDKIAGLDIQAAICKGTPKKEDRAGCSSSKLQPYDINTIWTGKKDERARCVVNGGNSCGKCVAKGYELTIDTTTGIGQCIPYSDKCKRIDSSGKVTKISGKGVSLVSDRIMHEQCISCDTTRDRLVKELDYVKNNTRAPTATAADCKKERCICIQNNCQCKTSKSPYTDIGVRTASCQWNNPKTMKDGTSFTQSCKTCSPGYHVNNKDCKENNCRCPNGTKIVSPDPRCTTDNMILCSGCDNGYHHTNTNQCVAWGVKCKDGTIKAKKNRTKDNDCASCNPGFHLDTNNQCAINVCKCQNGIPRTGTNCKKHDDVICASCNKGYDLLPEYDKAQIKLGKVIHKSNMTCQKRCEPGKFIDSSGIAIPFSAPSPGGRKSSYIKKICDTPIKSQDICRDKNQKVQPPLCHKGYNLRGGHWDTHIQPRCYDGYIHNAEKSCVSVDWRPKGPGAVTIR